MRLLPLRTGSVGAHLAVLLKAEAFIYSHEACCLLRGLPYCLEVRQVERVDAFFECRGCGWLKAQLAAAKDRMSTCNTVGENLTYTLDNPVLGLDLR